MRLLRFGAAKILRFVSRIITGNFYLTESGDIIETEDGSELELES